MKDRSINAKQGATEEEATKQLEERTETAVKQTRHDQSRAVDARRSSKFIAFAGWLLPYQGIALRWSWLRRILPAAGPSSLFQTPNARTLGSLSQQAGRKQAASVASRISRGCTEPPRCPPATASYRLRRLACGARHGGLQGRGPAAERAGALGSVGPPGAAFRPMTATDQRPTTLPIKPRDRRLRPGIADEGEGALHVKKAMRCSLVGDRAPVRAGRLARKKDADSVPFQWAWREKRSPVLGNDG